VRVHAHRFAERRVRRATVVRSNEKRAFRGRRFCYSAQPAALKLEKLCTASVM
jgi:hypothetical protein